MLKTIPKSNISQRKFQVYKLWNVSESEYPAVETSGSDALYRSVRNKYYSQTDGNLVNIFGSIKNPAAFANERSLPTTINVIDIPQNKVGERIKPNSVIFNTSDGTQYTDDGFGNIVNPSPTYELVSVDYENEILVIRNEGSDIEITLVNETDFENGVITLLYNSDTDTYNLVSINLELGTITFGQTLDFNGVSLGNLKYGNVFYSDGILVLDATLGVSTYTLEYRSTQTIYENEILITAKAGEFNYSQNPSAVNVILSGSYEFQTTQITNVSPSKTVKIKEVLDIERKEYFSGSVGSNNGTWEDYFTSSSIDPTGSYLTTYITTIGLYDDNGDMVAIAKLPKPVKNLPDYDINFLIRFDT